MAAGAGWGGRAARSTLTDDYPEVSTPHPITSREEAS